MRKYDSYKDSGIEWIGEIPSNWNVKKLKFVCKIFNGDSLKDEEKELYSQEIENSIPYVSTKDIDVWTAKINYENGLKIPVDHSKYKIAPKNSFLMCIEGGSAGRKYGHLQRDVFFVNKLACFETQSENNKFLYYYSQSPLFQSQFQNSLSGLIGGVAISQIRNFSVILPIPDEQTAIANYLDQKTSQIDDLIAKKERLIQLLEEERTAIINQAVTKGLDPNVPMKDSGVEWLGEIPAHWEVKKLKYVANLKSGENITSENIKEQGDYPVYGGNGLRGYFSDYTNEGDFILIGRQGALCGNIKYAKNRFWASEHAIVCYLEPNINWLWFGKLLESMNLNQYNQSAAQPGLAVGVIKNLSIPYPKSDQQNEIVEFIIEYEKRTDEIIEKTRNEIGLLKEYKTALISEVVTGKVDVRNEKMN